MHSTNDHSAESDKWKCGNNYCKVWLSNWHREMGYAIKRWRASITTIKEKFEMKTNVIPVADATLNQRNWWQTRITTAKSLPNRMEINVNSNIQTSHGQQQQQTTTKTMNNCILRKNCLLCNAKNVGCGRSSNDFHSAAHGFAAWAEWSVIMQSIFIW